MTNDILRVLLIHAHLPPQFWVEALHTTTHVLNRHSSSTIEHQTPYFRLLGHHPNYEHLRVFGCLCFPNTYATSPHKLAPRAIRCVFLGYALEHKGYRCLDLDSRRVIVSRHVTFDETQFPYSLAPPPACTPLATENPTPATFPERRALPTSSASPPGSARLGSAGSPAIIVGRPPASPSPAAPSSPCGTSASTPPRIAPPSPRDRPPAAHAVPLSPPHAAPLPPLSRARPRAPPLHPHAAPCSLSSHPRMHARTHRPRPTSTPCCTCSPVIQRPHHAYSGQVWLLST